MAIGTPQPTQGGLVPTDPGLPVPRHPEWQICGHPNVFHVEILNMTDRFNFCREGPFSGETSPPPPTANRTSQIECHNSHTTVVGPRSYFVRRTQLYRRWTGGPTGRCASVAC